jgi:hypothetical protein
MRAKIPLTVLLASTLSGLAYAHEREFTQSRDWFLPYKGESEMELRNFFDTTNGQYRGQFEYEYGITNWFAVEPGVEWEEKEDKNEIEVEGAELELRFHTGEFGYDKILPALNLEYEQPLHNEDGESSAFEVKTVLSRYGAGGKDFSINYNFGSTVSGDTEWESELTAGFIMPFEKEAEPSGGWHEGARFGVEFVQDFEEHDARVGPLAVYRTQASSHWNFLASYMMGINDRDGSNFDELTLIVEFEF